MYTELLPPDFFLRYFTSWMTNVLRTNFSWTSMHTDCASASSGTMKNGDVKFWNMYRQYPVKVGSTHCTPHSPSKRAAWNSDIPSLKGWEVASSRKKYHFQLRHKRLVLIPLDVILAACISSGNKKCSHAIAVRTIFCKLELICRFCK